MEPEPLRDDTDNAELLEKAPAADSGASMQSPSIEQQVMQPHEVKPLEAEPLQTEDRWIQSIRELVKQGNIDEAKKQLSDFRRIYPDYPVPEDLRNLN